MTDRARYRRFYNTDGDPQRWGRPAMPDELRVTRTWIDRAGIPSDGIVLELGCGLGALSDAHPGYVGLDFALPALRRFPSPRPRFQADMQMLPVRSSSVDVVFSWTAIEHVPRPELVLDEVERILKRGGMAILAPAWNVRTWASKALPVRPYAGLTLAEKLEKASIPLRNSLAWRALASLPARLWREARVAGKARLAFEYRKLSPQFDTYTYTDCDAFTSMDPHAALTFFLSRGWQVLSHQGFGARMLARHEPVVVRKP